MKRLKSVMVFLVILIIFLCYSYFNYAKRTKAVNAVEKYGSDNKLLRIFNLREMHFNLFDYLISDKSQNFYVFVDTNTVSKINDSNYSLDFVRWTDPQDLQTMRNYSMSRKNDDLFITIKDMFLSPTIYDTLHISEIKGTTFEFVNRWIDDPESLK